MSDDLYDFNSHLSDPDPVRRAQIQMKQPLPKRFYKAVTIGEVESGWAVLLDQRAVKTPAKKPLAVPTKAAAELLATEWDAQAEVINPVVMPVTRLVNSAIDGVANELDAVIGDIVNYAGTDLLCYRADTPASLVAAQAEKWDPVLSWAADSHGARFILAEGIIHQAQPETAIEAFARVLEKHREPLTIAALHTITTLTGSALLALAFAEGFQDAGTVWRAAHADEDWNIAQWGTDAEAEARRAARWADMKAATDLFDALKAA